MNNLLVQLETVFVLLISRLLVEPKEIRAKREFVLTLPDVLRETTDLGRIQCSPKPLFALNLPKSC